MRGYIDDIAEARSAGAGAFVAQDMRQEVIDLRLAELEEPGRLAQSLDELFKYAEAFRLAAMVSAEPT